MSSETSKHDKRVNLGRLHLTGISRHLKWEHCMGTSTILVWHPHSVTDQRDLNIYRTYKPSLYHILPSIYLLLQYSSKQLMDLKPQAQKLNSACWGWISQVYACVSNMSVSARKRHFDSLEPELQWFPAMQHGTEFRPSVRALLTLNQEPSLPPNIFPFKRMPAKCINR